MPRSRQDSKLANLDLNLLVSLDALLAERSVSRAAERLGLSQPSLSASLARLRRHFRDELLARIGNRYELTPLAAQLAEQTTGALAAVARVFADEWVCIVAAGHPGIGEKLTMADLERLPMVVTYQSPTAYTPAAKQLSMLGVQPRVQLVAESFLALPFLVAAGNGVALIQERLARQLTPAVPIRILPCPFDVASLIDALWWHPMYDRDPGHRWLRQLFAEAALSVRA